MSAGADSGLVALASARSCGLTTTTLALAAAWPRPRLVCELDPAGGTLAARLGLSARPGLLDLAAAAPPALDAGVLAAHLQVAGGLRLLVAPAAPGAMAAALGGRAGALAAQLAALPGIDVLGDCGRLVPVAPGVDEVLAAAGVVALVGRGSAEGFVALHHRLAALPAAVVGRTVVVLVGEAPGARAADFARALGVEVAGVVAEDWRGAAALAAGALAGPRVRRSALARSAVAVAAELARRLRPDAAPADGAAAGTGPRAGAAVATGGWAR